jgi:glycine amidinotransferase
MSLPSPVCSYNEWDLLEEVIVGSVDGAHVGPWDSITYAIFDPKKRALAFELAGKPFPPEWVAGAHASVEELARILAAEGVTVRRPDPFDFSKSFSTPDWSSPSSWSMANPRDLLIIFGDLVVEAPSPRRFRQHEVDPYRTLLCEYLRGGARWIAGPRPRLLDALYTKDFVRLEDDAPLPDDRPYPLTEIEPVFEAADFMRCGRDIFYQRSFVTNLFGIEWLQRHVGSEYRFHEVVSACRKPIHIDTTFLPLAPGKAIANPKFVRRLPPILDKWDILWAPEPVVGPDSPLQMDSWWLSMNMLSIDSERVIVDKEQLPLIAKLKDWGFKPIPIPFQAYYPFGGAIHCATLDVRRRGTLQSYF